MHKAECEYKARQTPAETELKGSASNWWHVLKRMYKQMQNKLYRKIKRRMIAEQAMKFPVPVHIEHRNFDTLIIRNLVDKRAGPANSAEYAEYIKRDMAHQLADKLMHEGYISYYTREEPNYGPISDNAEIEARIMVARVKE